MVEAHLLHSGGGLKSGGSVCLANLGGSCLHSEGSWRPGVPSLIRQGFLQNKQNGGNLESTLPSSLAHVSPLQQERAPSTPIPRFYSFTFFNGDYSNYQFLHISFCFCKRKIFLSGKTYRIWKKKKTWKRLRLAQISEFHNPLFDIYIFPENFFIFSVAFFISNPIFKLLNITKSFKPF